MSQSKDRRASEFLENLCKVFGCEEDAPYEGNLYCSRCGKFIRNEWDDDLDWGIDPSYDLPDWDYTEEGTDSTKVIE